ncbi:MAG TPA: hypothetical protein PLC89_23060 [Haliscomenobacter sp.]|uniref:hypothetical protein n=1 Tax=Haliscomenobacter sp. TaxID=2717303 RepID=UPI002C6C141C|nr:hypothetical protein [Haliscomenobacter sp.]HOY20211.1 hypothetical protein [Haliscomenobacter sp.]
MQKQNVGTELNAVILELESRQTEEGLMLKEQFHEVYESVKPINLIKSTFKEAAASQDLREDIINLSIGLIAGYVSKKIFQGVSDSPVKKLMGTVLQFGITTLIANNPETIKSWGKGLYNLLSGDREPEVKTDRT